MAVAVVAATTVVTTVVVTEAVMVAETATGTVDPLLPVETTVTGTRSEVLLVTTVTVPLVGTGTGLPLPDPGTMAETTDEALLLLRGRGTFLPGVAMTASKCKLPRSTWTLAAYMVAILDRLGISLLRLV